MPRLAIIAVVFLAVGLALGAGGRALWKKFLPTQPNVSAVLGAPSPKATPPKAARITIVMQSAFNPDISVIGEASRNLVHLVNQLSGGELELKLTEGKVVPMQLQVGAVKDGTIDASFGWPGYLRHDIPAMALFGSLPFGPNADELVAWMLQAGGEGLLQEIYARDGLHALMCGVIGPESGGWFRREVNNLADLKDMKVRFGGLAGEVMTKLGADVQQISTGEVYWAFERADIEAAELSMPSVDRDFGLHKLAKFYYFPGWHQPAAVVDFVVTKERWASLPERARAAIETACRANITWQMARAINEQFAALEFFRREGVAIRRWPDDIMRAAALATEEVMLSESERNGEFKRIWTDLNNYLIHVRDWTGMSTVR